MALVLIGTAEETLAPGLTDLPLRWEDKVELRRAPMRAARREKPGKSKGAGTSVPTVC